MRKIFKKLTFVIAFISLSFINLYAQGGDVAKAKKPFDAPMADALRASGKIYVVVVVLGIVLTGIFIYLISLDRKIKKIEQEVQG
ncbi:MAG TPA: CcmD family protein [Microscillaceae bacterium]|nr:CcmD family protein [Microscillaceae bacterium]